jgi:hypothetical protein
LSTAAFVYAGSARSRQVVASQFRGDASAPVEPWGISEQADGFVVSLRATSPRGRERARLQVEACPNGAAFGSLLCEMRTATDWTELGANAQVNSLALSVGGLEKDRLYHWRARLQFAPLTTALSGIAAAPNPGAGPWRRLQANGHVADIRTGFGGDRQFANGFE